MVTSILTIGDELLIGQTINTNAAYIGKKLSEIGFIPNFMLTIGDSEDLILQTLNKIVPQSDIIILTGGLGPTHDDITKKCIAKYFNDSLELNSDIYNYLVQFFQKRNRKLTKVNEEQALFPKKAIPIQNPKGTAPGIFYKFDNKLFFALPGVPFEMRHMLDEFVIKEISNNLTPGKVVKMKTLLTAGIPESYLYEQLGDLNEILGDAKLAFLPGDFGVKMRITVFENTEDDADNKISEIEQKIRASVGQYIYGTNDDTIEAIVYRLLLQRDYTLATAESCTGGLIAKKLTDIPGASEVYDRGVVVYSNSSKIELLGVNEELINKFGAVSNEVAIEMAKKIKSISGADIGLAVTGIMGPSGGTAEKPVGTVHIAICDDKGIISNKFVFGDDRNYNRERTVLYALDMLRKHLLGIKEI
jgi:nicotinamide-nucleotide amidase